MTAEGRQRCRETPAQGPREFATPKGVELRQVERKRGERRPPGDWVTAHLRDVHPLTGEHVGPWYLPSSVRLCVTQRWAWVLEHQTGELTTAPFRCGSWRCPNCGGRAGRLLADRILRTLQKCDARDLVFLTVTVPRRESPIAVTRDLGRRWEAFAKRMRYALGTGAGRQRRRAPIRYVQVFEAHRDPRWMHAHAVVESRELVRALRSMGTYTEADPVKGTTRTIWRYTPKVLAKMARAVGLGRIDAQPCRSTDALSNYLAKLGNELGGAYAKEQVPLLAPSHFRRVRSSHRFLAPIAKTAKVLSAALARIESRAVQRILDAADERLVRTPEIAARAAEEMGRWLGNAERVRESSRIAVPP